MIKVLSPELVLTALHEQAQAEQSEAMCRGFESHHPDLEVKKQTVAEQADVWDLKSQDFGHTGSIPVRRRKSFQVSGTKEKKCPSIRSIFRSSSKSETVTARSAICRSKSLSGIPNLSQMTIFSSP